MMKDLISSYTCPPRCYVCLMGYGMIIAYVIYIFWPVFSYPWWGADDPMILYKFKKHGLLSMLVSPMSWRDLTSFNFNPWLVVTLGIDLVAFGLNPLGYYIHQVLTVFLLVVAMEFFLRNGDKYNLRFLFILILLSIYPIKETVIHIFMRHYIEGLIFSIYSIYFWGKGKVIPSALFYFLAVCAKETYALLPMVLFTVQLPSKKGLLCLFIPAVLYVAWRAWMLGIPGGLGGYGCLIPTPTFFDVLGIPRLMASISGVPWAMSLGLFAVSAMGAFWRLGPFRLLFVLLALILPIFPVLKIAQGNSRYLFLLYVFCVLGAFWGMAKAIERCSRGKWTLMVVRSLVLAFSLSFVLSAKGLEARWFERRMAEGRFVWERVFPHGEKNFLVNYLMTPWHFEGLVRLRGIEDGPLYCHDAQFCVGYFENAHFWQWRNGAIRRLDVPQKGLLPCAISFEARYDAKERIFSWDAATGGGKAFYLMLYLDGVGLEEYQLPPSCAIGYVFSTPYPEIGIKLAGKGGTCYSTLVRPIMNENGATWKIDAQGPFR